MADVQGRGRNGFHGGLHFLLGLQPVVEFVSRREAAAFSRQIGNVGNEAAFTFLIADFEIDPWDIHAVIGHAVHQDELHAPCYQAN